MSEWTECTLGEIAQINPTERLPKGTLAKKIPMEALQPFAKKIPWYTDEEYKGGVKFKNGDTLIARITPSLENGKTAYVDILEENEIGFGSTEFIVLREIEEVSDKQFLYYFALSPEFREIAIQSMTGSTGRQRVQNDVVINHQFEIPPIEEQRAIANVLSALDDKIDLLHCQNNTLEELSQTLFRQWFIEEADDEWGMNNLGDVINIFDNKRIPLSKIEREKMKNGQLYPYYGAAQIMDYVNDYIFDGEYILLGEDGTVRTDEGFPVLQYATGKFWVNNHTHVIQAKEPYDNHFLWNFLLKKNIDEIVTGAVQPKINQTNLKSLEFPKYPEELVKEYQKQSNTFHEKIKQNHVQIKTLENLKDTILPKLMTGEVRVNY